MQMRKLLFPACIMLTLAACNENSNKGSNDADSTGSTETQSDDTKANTNATVRANIKVTITGGDMNGTYTAECKDACCSWGIAGNNVFGNQYSEAGKGANELSSVQLVVDDVTAGSKSTKEFMLTVSFGELFGENSKSFNINTTKGNQKGSGTVDLKYEGEKATVVIKGTSIEGPAIDLTIECNKVLTAQNIGQ